MSDIFSALKGFLGGYANEALSIAGSLTSLLEGTVLPSSEGEKVKATIITLQSAVNNINDFLTNKMPEITPVPVTINESDIETAVKNVLPDVLKSLGVTINENGSVSIPATDPNIMPTGDSQNPNG